MSIKGYWKGNYEVGIRRNTPAAAKMAEINVTGTRNVLEAMQELNIPRGVYTSSLAVYSDTHGRLVDESYRFEGKHLTVYDETKWRAHYEVALPMMQAGLPLIIVQPGVVYGINDHSSVRDALIQYLQGQLPMTPQDTAFCWAHVEDVAHGHLLAMAQGKRGESYHICGEMMTFSGAIALAQELTGVPAPTMHPSPAIMRGMANMMGLLEPIFPLPTQYRYESLRTIAGTTYIGTNEKARRELGYTPRPLREGLAEVLAHEQKLLQH
ncbi:MAG: NAD-dependent epimerase/dehydratase family protein [Phototrophicaceae bacterium]|jgi:nucleoside-diphosphate-sugar epimerase